jgi:hypothetical protein
MYFDAAFQAQFIVATGCMIPVVLGCCLGHILSGSDPFLCRIYAKVLFLASVVFGLSLLFPVPGQIVFYISVVVAVIEAAAVVLPLAFWLYQVIEFRIFMLLH